MERGSEEERYLLVDRHHLLVDQSDQFGIVCELFDDCQPFSLFRRIELIPTNSQKQMKNILFIVVRIGNDPIEKASENNSFISMFDRLIGEKIDNGRIRHLKERLGLDR